MGVFLEAVEDLGRPKLIPLVKDIAEMLITSSKNSDKQDGFDLERPMRTLASIVRPSDEDWILSKLGETDFGPGLEFPQLRQAIECFARIGSIKSLPYIQKVAIEHKEKTYVPNVCQLAYEQICNREKTSKAKDILTAKL